MSRDWTDRDEAFMRRALALALRGQGRVEPNPMVGCVLVRSGQVVGEGYHRRFGGPHAEVEALRVAGAAARGATAYVTLEPCSHYGKTPPCSNALIASGVRRVVAAMVDPFPKVRGRGLRQLRSAGIAVTTGVLAGEARRLNGPYLKRIATGRPWVILKWAQSLDGKIATRTGDSKWISGERSRRWTHRLRGRVDAVIVGLNTVLADDPELTCRQGPCRRVAVRVVLDPRARTPLRASLVRSANKVPTMVVADRHLAKVSRVAALKRAGVEVLLVRSTANGLNLGVLLDELGRRGMSNVLVEGGGRTLGAFFDAGLADEAIVFVSRRLIGGREAPSPLAGRGTKCISDVVQPIWAKHTRCGADDAYQLLFREIQG